MPRIFRPPTRAGWNFNQATGPSPGRSEVGLAGHRYRIEILLEMVDAAVIGANRFLYRHIVPAPDVLQRERLVEGIGVFHFHDNSQIFCIRTDGEAFHDVELIRVGRAEIVDEMVWAARQADRIHYQRVAVFVMADGLAEPGRLHIRRMLVGESNVADEAVALPQHKNFFGSLDEIEGLEKQVLTGHAAGPAARLGIEGKLALAAQQLIVGFLYLLGGPWLQDRVL